MSRFVVGIDLGTTNSALAYAEAEAGGRRPRRDQADADPPGRGLRRGRRAVGPALLPLPPFGQGVLERRRPRPPLVEGGRPGRRHLRPRSGGQGPRSPGRLGQELALARRGRSQEPDPPLGSARRGGQGLSARGLDRLPLPPPRRLEPRDGRQGRRRPAGAPGRDPDRPRLVRRRGPRADRRGRPGRGPRARHPPRGAPGRVLRLARLAGRSVAEAGQGRRPAAGLRRRRGDDRLHPDRRDRPGTATSP